MRTPMHLPCSHCQKPLSVIYFTVGAQPYCFDCYEQQTPVAPLAVAQKPPQEKEPRLKLVPKKETPSETV